jgi:hydroxypyruvate isomerase
MQRRSFLQSSVLATAALSTTAMAAENEKTLQKHNFKLKYAPHFGMFKNHAGKDPIDQLKFMADVGFTALEDNGMKRRSVADQEKIAAELQRLNMEMGVFVAYMEWSNPTLAGGKKEDRDNFLKEIRESLEVAKRVNAKWATVVCAVNQPRLDWDYQTANVVESLKRAAELCEKTGLVMVLEPLNPRDHPRLFLTKIPQAYQICKAVGSPCCKILDDLYHQQVTEGNLIPNVDRAWSEIAYFQMGDNPGRKEPTTGEINYKNVFKHIHDKGFKGIMGMEHGNAKRGKEGELALIKAYAECDSF